jgi:hypothetical protein
VKKKGIVQLTEGGRLDEETTVALFTKNGEKWKFGGLVGFQRGRSGRKARRSVCTSIFLISEWFGMA